MAVEINPLFNIGEFLYLNTDPDQQVRICTGWLVDDTSILYRLQCGTQFDYHYEMEISRDKDFLLTIG
jgi:hypothetical protein